MATGAPPGLFQVLIREGEITDDDVRPLIARLAEEQIVRAPARDGEAFDRARWPLAFDAAMAAWVAVRTGDPAVPPALAELRAAAGDRERLQALARIGNARMIAADGGDAVIFAKIWANASTAELAVFGEPPLPPATARVLADLSNAHFEAADGLYAFHVHRGLAGPAAEAAARLATAALRARQITVQGLIAAAVDLVVHRR